MDKTILISMPPAEFQALIVDSVNACLEYYKPPQVEPSDKLLTVQGAAQFLHLTVPSIYSKVSRNELPYMKRGKRLYFSRTELMDYLKAGRNKTNFEAEAEPFLKEKGARNE